MAAHSAPPTCSKAISADAVPMPMALPARAIRSRLLAAVETPSWAVYLPRLQLDETDADGLSPGSADKTSLARHSQGPRRPELGKDASHQEVRPDFEGLGHQVQHATNSGALQPSQHSVLPGVARHVWSLSRDVNGCRKVQNALEAATDEDRQALALELEGHVWEAMRCPHANYVIQKCIVTLRPQAAQFIIDEIMRGSGAGCNGASQAARHRYGCRILERLIEHCFPEQVRLIVEELVNDAVSLAKHPYGNYVMQHLLEHGQQEHRRRITKLLQQNAHTAGLDCYARAVISKALSHGQREDQVSLARALLLEPGLICTIARTRHGHIAAKFALQSLDDVDREEAYRQLSQDIEVLRASRYGRFVAACLHGAAPLASGPSSSSLHPRGSSMAHAHAVGGG
ncbi:unnamed protein product [Polarella glacialis]|uniref:PUM-HD domain-containing protein n=1 Tax=Polarella glacialis TaxID=89957 RepID=A0A813LSS1_POLGL|nr:unnamed protein product [Polarella glacialis]